MRMVRTLLAPSLCSADDRTNVLSQVVQAGVVRIRARANCNVAGRYRLQCRQQLETHELAEPSLHAISPNGAVFVSGNHDRNSRMTKRGSVNSDIEVRRPNPPPLSNDNLDVG